MPEILLLGLNHKTAPVALRECLAFAADETVSALDVFQQEPVIRESVIFSTCNRVEILMTADDRNAAVNAAQDFISGSKQLPVEQFVKSLYLHEGNGAVRHLFKVAASLDSMIVGEPQILGQLKEAYRTAAAKRTTGVILNRLMHKAFMVAKRIRTETGIGDHAVSISYAAIELARKIFGNLEDKKVLLIGAGEMAELAVRHLIRHQADDVYVANRTFERGKHLAESFNGRAVRFEDITKSLEIADIIISSTGASGFVLTKDQVKSVMRARKNRPIFFIDIAVPRDIDPDINKVSNAYVYDIDDLQGVIEENKEERNREAIKGEQIIEEAVAGFRHWFEGLDAVSTIIDLRRKMDVIAQNEMEKTFGSLKHISQKDRESIHKMVQAMLNKMLHDPTIMLKNNGYHGDKSLYIDAARRLFKLDGENFLKQSPEIS